MNYVRLISICTFFFFFSCQSIDKSNNGSKQWSKERTWKWYSQQKWLVGTNFITSNSINQLEFWQEETFDLELIEKELKLSSSIGMNTHRVFLHDLLWDQDSIGFIDRIDQFLEISDKYGIKIMFVIFDDVWHPIPELGKQPDPIPHIMGSSWVQSPGVKILTDTLKHKNLEPYVKGIIKKFANDNRVIAWDLYNEPGQYNGAPRVSEERVVEIYSNIGVTLPDDELPHNTKNYPLYEGAYHRNKMEPGHMEKRFYTLSLIKKVFRWARDVNPSQPITAGLYDGGIPYWGNPEGLPKLEQFIVESSDVISFHSYGGAEWTLQAIKELEKYGRPLICTEYLARGEGSTFNTILPIFKKHKIAAYNWGLVWGKTNTVYPWNSWNTSYTAPPKLWHHDIFYPNGEPFSSDEIDFIKEIISSVNK